MLVVTQVAPYGHGPAGVHGVLTQAATSLVQLGRMRGLDPRVVDDVTGLSKEDLSDTSLLALFTIGETPWSEEHKDTILSRVRAGSLSILGVHSATDSCASWEHYVDLVGARFDGHPWTCDLEVVVSDLAHPSTRDLPAPWHWHDEVYLFRALRPDARVLLRAAEEDLDQSVPGARRPAFGYPLAWCFEHGQGRCFYSSLGHFPAAWENPSYLAHLGGAIDWLTGDAQSQTASP